MVTFPETIPQAGIEMASIKDVAKLSGVSVSTVSRVINRGADVDNRTRDRVLAAIAKLEYKPNLLAKGLRGKKGNIIGLIVPEILDHAFVSIVDSTIDTAHENGYNVIVGSTHNDPDLEEKFIDDLLRRNVNGIVFSRVSDESRVLKKIQKMNVPIVIIDRALEKEGIPSVVLDNYEAGRLSAQHLVELGHREVRCVTGSLKISLCRDRLRGFKDVLRENGLECPDADTVEGDFKFKSGMDAVDRFCEDGKRFSAVWAQNDMMALGIIKRCLTKGMRIPEEVSVVGMDDISICEYIAPSLTTIHYPFKEMCEKAFELIVRQNGEGGPEDAIALLEPYLVKRDSTGPFGVKT
jgi:DNA-binding LacI/PurR family transcriptional regulator